MKPETEKLLQKSSRSIRAAERLLQEGDVDFAASRAYYALFYVAEALLNEKNLQFKKHGGVHGAFAEHFIKTKQMDPKFHSWLVDAFDERIQGDYEAESQVDSAIGQDHDPTGPGISSGCSATPHPIVLESPSDQPVEPVID